MSAIAKNSTIDLIENKPKHINTCFGWFAPKFVVRSSCKKNAFDKNPAQDLSQQESVIWLAYFSLLSIPLILYTFRYFDDNRLVSWYWSVSFSQALLMIGILSVVLLVAALLAKIELAQNKNITVVTILSFLILIPFWALPESIIDNARYFTQAKFVSLYGVIFYLENWGGSIFAWTDLPLIPLIYGVAFQIFGEHRFVIQILTGLFFSGSVFLTYAIGKTLWTKVHGFLGALLLLGMPYVYSQIPLMLIDIPTMFFLTLAFYVTIFAVNSKGSLSIAAASMTIMLALLSKYSTWIFLCALPLVIFTASDDRRVLVVKRFLQIVGVTSICAAMVFVYKHQVLLQQINLLFEYQWVALSGWQESNISTFLFQLHPVIAICATISIFIAIKNRDKNFLVVSGMLMVIFLLQIQRIRYLMLVFPMLALMAAYALETLRSVSLKKFIGYGVALSSYVMALVIGTNFLPSISAYNIKKAGEYLDSTNVNAVEVVVLPQLRSTINPLISVPSLDYHLTKPVVYKPVNGLQQITRPENANTSPVRFTWENSLPQFYTIKPIFKQQNNAIAVIYSSDKQLNSVALNTALSGHRLVKRFNTYSNVFRYKTLVNIYLPV